MNWVESIHASWVASMQGLPSCNVCSAVFDAKFWYGDKKTWRRTLWSISEATDPGSFRKDPRVSRVPYVLYKLPNPMLATGYRAQAILSLEVLHPLDSNWRVHVDQASPVFWSPSAASAWNFFWPDCPPLALCPTSPTFPLPGPTPLTFVQIVPFLAWAFHHWRPRTGRFFPGLGDPSCLSWRVAHRASCLCSSKTTQKIREDWSCFLCLDLFVNLFVSSSNVRQGDTLGVSSLKHPRATPQFSFCSNCRQHFQDYHVLHFFSFQWSSSLSTSPLLSLVWIC